MSSPTLKPCPFCGESAGWVTDECGIECGHCVATGPWRDLHEADWNTRPIEDALRVRAEAAEAALATARAEGAAAERAAVVRMLRSDLGDLANTNAAADVRDLIKDIEDGVHTPPRGGRMTAAQEGA
jgi:hypothetical protein